MQGCYRAWVCEFSGVALSCFTLSRSTIFSDVSLIKPEDSLNPFFNAVLFSVLEVRKLVNSKRCLLNTTAVKWHFATLPIIQLVERPTETPGAILTRVRVPLEARDVSPSRLPVQTDLRCPYNHCVKSHATTSVRTLKTPNTGSHHCLDKRKCCTHR